MVKSYKKFIKKISSNYRNFFNYLFFYFLLVIGYYCILCNTLNISRDLNQSQPNVSSLLVTLHYTTKKVSFLHSIQHIIMTLVHYVINGVIRFSSNP